MRCSDELAPKTSRNAVVNTKRPSRDAEVSSVAPVCVFTDARRILKRARDSAAAGVDGIAGQAATSSSDTTAQNADSMTKMARYSPNDFC
jgi:hypothetical protein